MLDYTRSHTYYNSIYNHFHKKPNNLILCTHTEIYYDSIFALNYIQIDSIYICTHRIHVKLKIIYCLH